MQLELLKKQDQDPNSINTIRYENIIELAKINRHEETEKNHTRRFFETRLSQYINGVTHTQETIKETHKAGHTPKEAQYKRVTEQEDLKDIFKEETHSAVNKILKFFLGDKCIVDNPTDMETQISIFANSYKNTTMFNKDEIEHFEHLAKKSLFMAGRDRISRDKDSQIVERKFEIKPEQVGESVLNTSGGLMKSTTPTFYDAQIEPIRNIITDTAKIEPKDESKSQWSRENHRERTAYAGSISGHTACIVGMLEKYMKDAKAKNDPNLQKDIELFLMQVIATYAKKSFHGMLEVIDVLHAKEIQEIFAKYNVAIDLYKNFSNNPETLQYLKYAMNDASMYARVLVGKEQSEKKVIEKYKNKMKDINKTDRQNQQNINKTS